MAGKRKVLKTIIVATLLISMAGLAAFLMDWSYLWTFGIAAMVLALAYVSVIGWGYWQKRKLDADYIEAYEKNQNLRTRIDKLDELWKSAVRRIKSSKLKEKGNPVYVLPWYLMLGEAGSGKTSSIRNSRVAIPLLDGKDAPDPDSGLSNWWLLDEAIMIDTPGRYVLAESEVDNLEWKRFVSMFTRYRRWQPLNGVIVTFPADKIMRGRPDDVRAYAGQLRERLAELVKICGVRFPVYIMVTKTDLVSGMSRFFDRFPEAVLTQAMGGLVSDMPGVKVADQVNSVMDSIDAKLRELRFALLADNDSTGISAPAYLFPEELGSMKQNLSLFAHNLLDDSYYKEAPVFRGVYFTSGKQEGVPATNLLPPQFSDELASSQRVGERSLFLRGFIGHVLKKDKELVTPTAQALYMRRIRQNLGMSSWVAGCAVAALLMSFSFFNNMTVLGDSDLKLPADIVLKDDLVEDLAILNEYREAILYIQRENESSWIPTMGLDHSEQVEKRLAVIYATKFREAFLVPFEKTLTASLNRLDGVSTPDVLAAHVDFLIKRIGLHQSVLNGESDLESIYAMAQPDFEFMIDRIGAQDDSGRLVTLLRDNFLAYLVWGENDRLLQSDLDQDESRLSLVLRHNDIGLDWLVAWANLQQDIEDVDHRQYWGSPPVKLAANASDGVERAYTPEGWAALQVFLGQIERAVADKELVAEKKQNFLSFYRQQYFTQWGEFLASFDAGASGWVGRDSQKELAARLVTDKSPYHLLLSQLVDDVVPGIEISEMLESDLPGWVTLLYRYQKLMDPEYQQSVMASSNIVGKIAKKGTSALGRFKKLVRGSGSDESMMIADRKAIPLLNSYHATLALMAEQTQTPNAAFDFTKANYVENKSKAGEPKEAMNLNQWDIDNAKVLLGSNKPEDNIFWRVLEGQSRQLWRINLAETEHYLDTVWNETVLAQADGLSGWQKVEVLQGTQGSIWSFEKEYAGAFVSKRGKYRPVDLYGDKITFSNAFLEVLNRGRVSQQAISGSYRMLLSAVPTDVNSGATVKPHLTKLSINCSTGFIEFENRNFPTRKRISWSPQDCGDVSLQIHVGDLVLEKRYPGYNGFVKFLRDFRSGRKVFRPQNFVAQRNQLKGYGVNTITVGYRFSGQNSVLKLALKDPSSIPSHITDKTSQLQFAGQ